MAKLLVVGIAIVFASIALLTVNGSPTGGELGEATPPTENITQLVERKKPDIIKKICDTNKDKCPSDDAKIEVIEFKSQVVSGVNHFVNCKIGDSYYVVRFWIQSWTNTEEVSDVQGPKSQKEEITYF